MFVFVVGDKETTNVEMTEFFSETTEVKDKWWVGAIVLGVAGLAAVGYYLYMNGFNDLGSKSVF